MVLTGISGAIVPMGEFFCYSRRKCVGLLRGNGVNRVRIAARSVFRMKIRELTGKYLQRRRAEKFAMWSVYALVN